MWGLREHSRAGNLEPLGGKCRAGRACDMQPAPMRATGSPVRVHVTRSFSTDTATKEDFLHVVERHSGPVQSQSGQRRSLNKVEKVNELALRWHLEHHQLAATLNARVDGEQVSEVARPPRDKVAGAIAHATQGNIGSAYSTACRAVCELIEV